MKDFSNSDKNCQQRTGVIYKITNLVNNMSYVGQTVNLKQRLKGHRLGKKQLIDKAIQKHGWENFSVEVLEENIPIDMLDEREIFWIAENNCIVPNGYNLDSGGGVNRIISDETRAKLSASRTGEKNHFFGKHHTPETKKKISEANTGKKRPPISEETRAKKSAAQKGKPAPNKGKHHTEETKKKLSIANQGKKRTEETRKKISEVKTGMKHTEESKRKMSESRTGEKNHFYGKHHTEESKQKMSESHKGQVAWNKGIPRTDEEKAKISETTRAAMTPEVRAKISAANKGKTLSAEHRAKISATLRTHWAEKKKNSEEGCEE